MDEGNCVVTRAEDVGAPARPFPPLLGGPARSGMTARVLPTQDGPRVLIADDDADTADSLALLLEFWGYEVWVARGGAEALATAFRIQPDVLFLDVAMPGLDGFGVARAIRQRPCLARGAVLVAVTGYADEAHRERAERAGFDHYLVKPTDPSAVRALLHLAAGRPHELALSQA